MMLRFKKSLPGKHEIIHAKPSSNPRYKLLSFIKAAKLGIDTISLLIISTTYLKASKQLALTYFDSDLKIEGASNAKK